MKNVCVMTLKVSILLIVALAAASRPTQAQEPVQPSVHWAYASFFGTGWYKINEQRSAFVVRTGPRRTFGESGFDPDGKRDIAYTLYMPITVGFANLDFNNIPGIVDPDNFATASANLSIDADIPVTQRLSIRPIVQAGYGTVINESDSAWTYKTEIKSRYSFQSGKLDWSLLFGLGFLGYNSNNDESDDFAFASVGAEFALPISWLSSSDSQSMLYWHIAYVDFIDDVEVVTGVDTSNSIADYIQVGAAFGKRDNPIKIWFLKFDRLGLAYDHGTTGKQRGIKFVFRSLYDI